MNALKSKLAKMPPELRHHVISTVLNDNLINFLCKAYQIPSSFRAAMIDMCDSVAERNIGLFTACFCIFLNDISDTKIDSKTIDLMDMLLANKDLIDSFLATAVKLTYSPSIEDILKNTGV